MIGMAIRLAKIVTKLIPPKIKNWIGSKSNVNKHCNVNNFHK